MVRPFIDVAFFEQLGHRWFGVLIRGLLHQRFVLGRDRNVRQVLGAISSTFWDFSTDIS